jgi:hypothetical protein
VEIASKIVPANICPSFRDLSQLVRQFLQLRSCEQDEPRRDGEHARCRQKAKPFHQSSHAPTPPRTSRLGRGQRESKP